MRFRLISIDLDGTLVDTADEIVEAANRTLEDCGLPRQPAATVTRLIGAGTHSLMRRLVEQVLAANGREPGSLPLQQVLARLDVNYAATAGTTAKPYPGVPAALQQLKDAGHRLVCLTNKEERFARQVLQATQLDGYFERLIGGDTLDVRKPDPAVVAHVLAEFGEDASAMAHIGDSSVDVETGLNAGIASWAVPYGYNAGSPIAASRPQRIFDSLSEMAAYVLAADTRGSSDPLPVSLPPGALGRLPST